MVKTSLALFNLMNIISLTMIHNSYINILSKENEISQLIFKGEKEKYNIQSYNNGTASILLNDNQQLINFNEIQSMQIIPNLNIEADLNLQFTYSDTSLIYENTEQWVMVNYDDFQGSAQDWSKEKLSVCGTNDNIFLGGHCNFGGEEVFKVYKNLPVHKMIKITANFHFFDKWEGEEAYMNVDKVPVWSDTYQWCDKVMQWYCKKYSINACGAEFPDRLSVPINFEMIHSADKIEILFGALLDKSSCEASWGIDDVTIYVK